MRLVILDSASSVGEWSAKYVLKRIRDFNPGPNKYYICVYFQLTFIQFQLKHIVFVYYSIKTQNQVLRTWIANWKHTIRHVQKTCGISQSRKNLIQIRQNI